MTSQRPKRPAKGSSALVPKDIEAADGALPGAPPGSPPPRTLSAARIGQLTGRSPRKVQIWAKDEGCPHSVVKGKGQHGEFRFNIDEVHNWLDMQGLARQQLSASESSTTSGDLDTPLLDEMDKVLRGAIELAFTRLVGRPDYERRIVVFRAKFEHLATLKSGRTPMEQKVIDETMQKISQEIRMLEEFRVDEEERQRTLVPRAEAEMAVGKAAMVIQSTTRGLAQKIAAEMAIVFAPALDRPLTAEMLDQAQRQMVSRALAIADQQLVTAADAIAATAAALAKGQDESGSLDITLGSANGANTPDVPRSIEAAGGGA